MIATFCLVSAGCVWALGETRRADLYRVGD